jgi:TetR/AcrR family transcriptional repressor of lmrAB and yxaGH operons
MIEAAADAFERDGFSGAGLAAILEASAAPRGSLYFHFPGGKEELARAAVGAAATQLGTELEAVLRGARSGETGIARVVKFLGDRLEDSGFEKGCPITSIVASSSGAPNDVRECVADAMTGLERRLALFLEAHGHTERDAARKATVVLAAIEGALLLARVKHSREPLTRVEKALPALLA